MKIKEAEIYNLVIERGVNSLINVCSDQKDKDVLLKTITFLNLIKKFLSSRLPLTIWRYGGCTVKVKFLKDSYSFYLPKGYDFNIYLNPYFHEYEVTQFVFRSLSLGDIFFDVGAHGGLFTIIAGKKVGRIGKVLSFEPNPLNLNFLRLNIKLNGLNNVTVIPKAVSHKSGKIKLFYMDHETALTSARRIGESVVETEAITIDEVAKQLDFIKIIKIDTEGNDWKVLKGALETLRKTCYAIVEQNTFNVRQLLYNLGFELSTLKPSGYLLATNKLLTGSIDRTWRVC
jgi:FkbM family methyltransferase